MDEIIKLKNDGIVDILFRDSNSMICAEDITKPNTEKISETMEKYGIKDYCIITEKDAKGAPRSYGIEYKKYCRMGFGELSDMFDCEHIKVEK